MSSTWDWTIGRHLCGSRSFPSASPSVTLHHATQDCGYTGRSSEVSDYQRRLGSRLRAIRQQQGLTLQQVEEISSGKWKAVVVGSYERGDRAVSVAKLAELSEFYNVPVSELLPKEEMAAATAAAVSGPGRVMLDLRKLSRPDLEDRKSVV